MLNVQAIILQVVYIFGDRIDGYWHTTVWRQQIWCPDVCIKFKCLTSVLHQLECNKQSTQVCFFCWFPWNKKHSLCQTMVTAKLTQLISYFAAEICSNPLLMLCSLYSTYTLAWEQSTHAAYTQIMVSVGHWFHNRKRQDLFEGTINYYMNTARCCTACTKI